MFPRRTPSRCAFIRVAPVLLSVWLCAACTDLDTFKTEEGSVFRGQIAGRQEGNQDGSFVRRGFPPRTELELAFDPSGAYREPGALTLIFHGGAWQTRAPLIPLTPLAHDLLSQYDFPGEGRLRNYVFGATLFSETLFSEEHPEFVDVETPEVFAEARAPRDVNVFLSLMADGAVEVRIMTPRAELFGVFTPLRRGAPR